MSKQTVTTTITTITEAETYVCTVLGDYAHEYDVEAIARDLTSWENGRLVLNIDVDSFWDIVHAHEL